MYSHCPLCIKKVPVNGVFEDLKPLDFGDDWVVNDYNNKFYVLNNMPSRPQADVPLFLNGNDIRRDPRRSGPRNIPVYPVYQMTSTTERKSSSFFSKFAEIQERESRYGYSIEIDPLILIGNRTSSADIRFGKHIDMMAIVKSGIKVEFILNHGYVLIDFIILDATMSHMVQLGFNSDIWKRHKTSLPYLDTIRHFGLKFGDVFNLVCQRDIERFAWLEFSTEEMTLTCTNVSLLVFSGLNKQNISLFNIDMEGWVKMGMDFHTLKNILRITRLDVKIILKWTSEAEIDVTFQGQFEQLFKRKFTELEQGTEEYYTNQGPF